MSELVKEGKVKYLGLSECSAKTLERACKIHHIAAAQMEYSPFSLDIERKETRFLKTARELGTAIVAYSPLGRGLLTGSVKSRADLAPDDFRLSTPRFSEKNFSKNLEVVAKFEALAKKKGCKASQLCLAWLMAQGEDIIPIPGTTRLKNFEENAGALKIHMTDEEVAEVRKFVEAAEVFGERSNPAQLALSYVDTPERKSML